MKRLILILTATAISFGTAHAVELNDTLQSGSIEEVVITGTRAATNIRHLSQTVNVIDRKAIEESNRLSLLPLLTEQVPGLFITQRGFAGYGVSGGSAGNISMRGLSGSSSRFLVLIDGHPNYAGIYGHPIADSYQSRMTDRVEVVRGPASLLYGSSAMGGVINIVTRKPAEDGTRTNLHMGYGSFNTFESELFNTTRYGKFSSAVSGSYSRSNGHRENMNFEQYGGYAKLGYDISDNWDISANLDVTRYIASQPGPENAPLIDADQKITRGTTALFLENRYSRTSGAFSLFYSWGDHWINDGYATGGSPRLFRFVSYDEMLGASVWQSANLFKGNRLTAGIDFYRYGGKADNHFVEGLQEGTYVPQVDKREDNLAGYVEMRQLIGSLITLNAGLRADRHFTIGTELVPQAGIALNLPAGAGIKFSAGKGFRYPIIREMYMYPPQNPHLKPESLWNYELSFTQRLLAGKLNYGINLFYIDAENIILILPNPNGAGMLNQNSGKLKNSGVELQASYLISKSFAVNGNYSFLDMETPVIGAPKHKAYLGGSYSIESWQANTGLQYINGLYSSINPEKKEDFLLWNIRLSYSISDMLQLWVNGYNLLNTKYQINAGFPMPGITFMGGINLNI
ncbi:MAG TPA: TonB-dependent receptor [Bacteroidaceae bacterium]|nr:TonB-dependent receptor [Bacteroidaceae bacterium]